MKKNTNGITLISLVVTIIILIILAGVSIILIFGENGLIERTKKQAIEQEKAQILEQLELAKGSITIDGNGYTNLSKYLESIENKKIANKYEITKIKQIDEANALIWVNEKYKYTAAQIGIDVIINAVGYMTPTINSFVIKSFNLSNISVEAQVFNAENYELYISEDNNNYQKVEDIKANETNNEIDIIDYKYDISNNSEYNKTYYLKIIAKNKNGEDIATKTATIEFKEAFSGSVNGYSSAIVTHADTYFPLNIVSDEMNEYFTYSNNIITFKKKCIIIFEAEAQRTKGNCGICLGYYLNRLRPTNGTHTATGIFSTESDTPQKFNFSLPINANDYLTITWKTVKAVAGNAESSLEGKINLKIKILEY